MWAGKHLQQDDSWFTSSINSMFSVSMSKFHTWSLFVSFDIAGLECTSISVKFYIYKYLLYTAIFAQTHWLYASYHKHCKNKFKGQISSLNQTKRQNTSYLKRNTYNTHYKIYIYIYKKYIYIYFTYDTYLVNLLVRVFSNFISKPEQDHMIVSWFGFPKINAIESAVFRSTP